IIAGAIAYAENFGIKKRMPRPHEYGNVTINNYSERNNIAPVVFNHWLHRAKYTCRLCHVDLGFGMRAGSTEIKEEDNKKGVYCGACHNGKDTFGAESKDALGNVMKNCYRCHSYGKNVKFEKDFYEFVKNFPKSRYGNRVDWLETENKGLVKLKDYIEGISIKRKELEQKKEIDIKARQLGMPDIIFSHKKHTIWNGCELCHPEIFGVKKGSTVYSMQDIFDGKYCGACHGSVAFPNNDCQLCHTKEVY
ncbi:MAG: c(7)-type cytochrome triheme domain-containing protein, partial [bacterium]